METWRSRLWSMEVGLIYVFSDQCAATQRSCTGGWWGHNSSRGWLRAALCLIAVSAHSLLIPPVSAEKRF